MKGKHKVAANGKIDWISTIQDCGLEVTRTPPTPETISPSKAILFATSGNTIPSASAALDNGISDIDDHWQRVEESLLSHSGMREFLITLWGPGSTSEGWFQVKDSSPKGVGLPSRVLSSIGKAEFFCLSLDGSVMCAVTTEEDEYWIITHKFQEGH